ncbi:hypothetical protein [Methylobacterium platani]|uniref:Uncharacterized protein n=2 Tax=Methylobacterium platani TaxID=427683 RepID=A0A179S5Y6_9HYPH|nr:hypothetical protein [Methylobacterium platani]KMO09801.1 hypothetical protein SQ03_31520 [Methylobacterium platani JCM 14648]OAS22604.1 hypothetical protein A5481_18730 [Methylobacterium platani]
MPTHATTTRPTPPRPAADPLGDARDLQASIAALRLLLRAQSRQLEALERRLSPAGSPAETGARRLRALKAGA